MKRILLFLCVWLCILPCGCTNRALDTQGDGITLTIAVPESDKEIISKYLSEYKHQSGIDFKIIDVSGDSEDIHRFFVSTCMDNKFNVDMYLMEDKWIKEFVDCGYIDEISLSGYDFIPAVQKSITHFNKTYAVPLYADVYAEFTKRSSASDKVMFFEENTHDYIAGVYGQYSGANSLSDAVLAYEQGDRIHAPDGFLFGDFGKAVGWLGIYNTMKKQHVVEASDVSININENALLKTKAFAVCAHTKHKEEAQKVSEFFLKDKIQKSLMTDITAIPVLKSFYERDDLYDITPHVLHLDGMEFEVLENDEHYTADIRALTIVLNQPEAETEQKLALIDKLINK